MRLKKDSTYVPSLSLVLGIMDGKFDDDKAYLFTAPSKTLVFTNGDSNCYYKRDSSLTYRGGYYRDYYVKIPFNQSDQGKLVLVLHFIPQTMHYKVQMHHLTHIVDCLTLMVCFNVYIYVGSAIAGNNPDLSICC